MGDGFVLVSLLVPECHAKHELRHSWERIYNSLDKELRCRYCLRCINTYVQKTKAKPEVE